MKAVVYKGPLDVAVEEVPNPRIEQPLDSIIRITTNICGSDLHPDEGRAPLDAGMVLGHENMGIVEEIGPGVGRIKPGDRVSAPFNISCGTCRNCDAGWTCACLRANPSGRPTAGYGYPMMGPYWGGQAEYLRVPWADFNLLKLPAGTEYETDFTLLSDIFPTGYHGTELARVGPGDTVAIFGATAINFAEKDPTEVIMHCTDGFGVDRGVEAVGYQAHDPTGQEHPEMVLDKLVEVVRATARSLRSSYLTSYRWNRPRRPTTSSTSESRAGPKSYSTPQPEHHLRIVVSGGSWVAGWPVSQTSDV